MKTNLWQDFNAKNINRLLGERMDEIQKIVKETDFNNLTYSFKGPNITQINFIRVRSLLYVFKEIKNGIMLLQNAEEAQKQFKSKLNEITIGNPKTKLKYQLDAVKNVRNLYHLRQKVLDLSHHYPKIRSEAIYGTKSGTGLKILTIVNNY